MAEISKQALKVENNTSFPDNNSGAITPSDLRGFNVDMIDSTVNQATYTSDSASWNQQIDALESFTASQQPSFNSLNAFTASQLTINSGVNAFTQSANGRLNNLEAYTASFTTSVGIYDEGTFVNNVNQINFVGNGITASFVSGKAVVDVDFTKLNSATASLQAQLATIGGQSGSWITESETGSFVTSAITASTLITASFNNGTRNLTFTKGDNTIFNVNIPDVSGSSGDFITTASFNAYTASNDQRVSSLESNSASVNVSISNLNSATASYVTETESGSFLITASFDNGNRNLTFTKGDNTTFNVNIPDVSGSAGTFVTTSSFNAYTSSNDQRVTSLESNSASVNVSISNLNSATASYVTETESGSFLITASFNNGTRDLTFTKGNATQFSVNIPDVSGSGGSINTGSFFVSASNSNNSNVISFFQGDGNVLGITVNTGSLASLNLFTQSADISITNLNSTTASLLVETANLETFSASALVSISNLNASSASQQVSIDSLNARTGSYATTGSNSFNGNQIITGSVFISSSAQRDLVVNGQVFISSSATGATTAPTLVVSGSQGQTTINRNNITVRNLTNSAALSPQATFAANLSTADEIGFSVDPAAFPNWSFGPGIYVNNTADTYPAIFGFQNKANYTDGRVTVLTPLIVTNGLQVTGSTAISGAIEIKGNVNQLTGSITAFGNVRTTNGTFTSSVNGGLEIDGIGYVGSGSAGAFFVGTTTQDLKIQNWYSSSVDGKNIVIENYSPTGSATPIYGKVALRARGVGGAVTVENSDQFRVEAPYSVFSGSVYIATGSLQNGITETVVTYNTATGELKKATLSDILSASFDAAEFWSTTTQSGSAGVSGSITFNNSGSVAGISVVNNSQITLSQAGTYNIQFSAQLETSAGADTIYMWFKKNGTNISDSASKAVLSNNTAQIMTVNILDAGVANDYYELAYQTTNGHATVLYEPASGNIPAIPSVILTIQQIR
jgi:uncharacterized coiled-coil protein SlyX